jgi:O6-methylguanine-DNA--protein-cysteine methyltransferase
LLRFLLALDGQADGSQALARNSVPIAILCYRIADGSPSRGTSRGNLSTETNRWLLNSAPAFQ